MSLTDYYNAQANASMNQLWEGIGQDSRARADAVLEKRRERRALDEANENIRELNTRVVRHKKYQMMEKSWKDGWKLAFQDFLKKEFPEKWEEKWEIIEGEIKAISFPLMKEREAEIDKNYPEQAKATKIKFS